LTDSIEHLIAIVKHLDLPSFHLFGHSFGGILAFEYMKVAKPNNCQSLTLASAPTSTKLILEETHRLSVELAAKMGTIATEEGDEDGDEDEDEIQDTNQKKKQSDAFSKVHECRLEFLPLALQDAYAQAAPTSWRGLQAIEDYQAETESPVHVPPTMIIVGEYDFCTSKCLEGWHELLNPPPKNVVSVQGTSHYGMLENEGEYGKAVFEFIKGNDP
jgi:proline iminopeptidase